MYTAILFAVLVAVGAFTMKTTVEEQYPRFLSWTGWSLIVIIVIATVPIFYWLGYTDPLSYAVSVVGEIILIACEAVGIFIYHFEYEEG